MSNTLELNCLVFGDDNNHIFPVKILCTESVGALKEAIKSKKNPTFQHVDAATLTLWKVSFPVDRSFQESLNNHKFVDEESLSPVEELSNVFSEEPPVRKSLHIVVKAPPTVIHLASPSSTLQLFCYVRGDDYHQAFEVEIGMEQSVASLKQVIKEEIKHDFDGVDAYSLFLWNVNIPGNENLKETIDKLGLVDENILSPFIKLSNIFPQQPAGGHLHIVVKELPIASRKHPRSSPAGDDDREVKRKQAAAQKKWNVNGAIRRNEANGHYYLDPGTQAESKHCLDAVLKREFLLLAGARASGKSTRLLWLEQKLEVMGYWPLYLTFEWILTWHGTKSEFWKSFGVEVDFCAAAYRPKGHTTVISSQSDFLNYFRAEFWNSASRVILLIDDFDTLYCAPSDVLDDCLQALQALKHSPSHALHCLIAAGTFGIVHLNLSPTTNISLFNTTSIVQNPYFSFDETRKLFHEFAKDIGYHMDDDIIEDVWDKSNGHPGMVCLCGRTISRNLKTLVDMRSRTILYRCWQQFPIEKLYSEIASYNTFSSMVHSLSRPEAYPSLILLRSYFVGFLDEVTLKDKTEEALADFLTSEGVLLKSHPAKARYRMASALVDGYIRNRLIPLKFHDAPLSALPLQHNGAIHVLDILIEALKYFDKNLIWQASSRSYKTSKVTIHGSSNGRVPRESVYDTELMRILSNWLRAKYGWTVTGQWHLRNRLKKNKYSDIVIKKEKNGPTIVFELLATGEPSFVASHIEKTPEYKKLLSADEAWVVHFTCEKDYRPIWQTDKHLSDNINVVHFAHNFEFTKVLASVCWKDCDNNVHKIVNRLLKM